MEGCSKADLHVHSKYSNRPAEWFLRRAGAPECYTEPLELYRRARAAGMDFVTIADHNTIDGALAIADRPHTFLSAEITTYFPEDGCKIHLLATGISEEQFREIQTLRPSIYELRQYLAANDILCAVNHPLYRVNDRLSVNHVERLLVMFKRFEVINGTRDQAGALVLRAILEHLTPEAIAAMAERHGLEPSDAQPWIKWTTGGSDDHSGVHIGAAYTVTPRVNSVDEFLEKLRQGAHHAGGASGSSLSLARGLYHIVYSYYEAQFLRGTDGRTSVLGELLRRLLNSSRPESASRGSRLIPGFVQRLVRARRLRNVSEMERLIARELSQAWETHGAAGVAGSDDRRLFETTCRVTHLLSYNLLARVAASLREGAVAESLQNIAALGTVALGVTPYLASFGTQHKDEAFFRTVAARFPAARAALAERQAKAWVTDTLTDVNGVARTVLAVGEVARQRNAALEILTCLPSPPATNLRLKNFAPLGTFPLPEYEAQELAFPPFLEIIEHLERGGFREVILSTPGPMGLVGLAAARLLRIRKTGIYHTDVPLFVHHMTGDHNLAQLAWQYMYWFYSQMDLLLVPSDYYRRQLIAHGFAPQKLAVLGRGVDLTLFNPRRRDAQYWRRHGLKTPFTFLYAGRVSVEKNLGPLFAAFERLAAERADVGLAIVGDGPLWREYRARYAGPRVAFTGFLKGEELARAYASADALVFPSKSDTFGNVVLEAQACGLPAIVVDRGGPPELVRHHGFGIVVDPDNPDTLRHAMCRMIDSPELCAEFRRAALAGVSDYTWDRVFESLWDAPEPPPTAEPEREFFLEPPPGSLALDVA
jgi:glycosyltransferase involved in cell wall biosynthesis/predicted metal-dependent phosphoesterase TrpH